MRILMIWSENLNKAGSGRTHWVHLAAALAARGHQVRLLAPGYRPRTTEPLPVPVSYLNVGPRSTAAFLLFHLLLALCLPFILIFRRPEVVYTRGLFHSFLMHLICRCQGVRYVAEIDSMVDEELAMRGRRGLARLIRLFDRWNLRWASAFVCVTPKLREELIRGGARRERVMAIHNGAAVDLFVPGDRLAARRELGLPEDAALIGFTGVLAAWQGLDLLIDAAARLPSDRPWQVLIVGSGEMKGELLRRIADGRLEDRVRLLPEMPHSQVPRLVQAFDLVVVPIHDPRKLRYGLSVLKFWEALSVGLPVLVPDQGDLGDVLRELRWPGEFASGDAADLARRIGEVMADLPALRRRQAEIHQLIRQRHSWAAVAERTENLFDSLMTKRSSQ